MRREFNYWMAITNSPLVPYPIKMQDLHLSTSWVILKYVSLHKPSIWPSSPRVSRSLAVRAPNRYLGGQDSIPDGDSDFFVPRL